MADEYKKVIPVEEMRWQIAEAGKHLGEKLVALWGRPLEVRQSNGNGQKPTFSRSFPVEKIIWNKN